MNAENPIFGQVDADAEAAADARAADDIRAGRVIDHADVSAWLGKWGTPDEQPAPPDWRA